MNRAFVKDPDDAGIPETVPERPQSPHPNYVTPAGLRQLQASAAALAGQRDWLQAAGKQASPQELAMVQRDLRWVEERLRRAIPVDSATGPRDRVHFGARVEVADEDGTVATYTIVGEDEADPSAGKVSWVSPLAEALLHAEVGEEVVWRRPAGPKRLEILAIHRGAD